MWNIAASSAADNRSGRAKSCARRPQRRGAAPRPEIDVGQERLGVEVVEPVVDVGHRHRGQRCGGNGIEPQQVPERKVGLRSAKTSAFQGGLLGSPRKVSRLPSPSISGSPPPRATGPARVAAAQQRPQVVVLAEERVKAPVVGHLGAGQFTFLERLGPASHPAAEVELALEHLDGDPALHQSGGRGQPAMPPPTTTTCGVVGSALACASPAGRVRDAAGVHHRGASPRKVCTMSRCQPGMVSLCTPVNPAAAIRR